MSANGGPRNDFRAASGLKRWPSALTGMDPAGFAAPPPGPGLLEAARAGGAAMITSARRMTGAGRAPGSALVASAAILLGLLAAGLFVVSAGRAVPVRVRGQAPVLAERYRGGRPGRGHDGLLAAGARPGDGRPVSEDRAGADRGLRGGVGRPELRRGGCHLTAQRGCLRDAAAVPGAAWSTGLWRWSAVTSSATPSGRCGRRSAAAWPPRSRPSAWSCFTCCGLCWPRHRPPQACEGWSSTPHLSRPARPARCSRQLRPRPSRRRRRPSRRHRAGQRARRIAAPGGRRGRARRPERAPCQAGGPPDRRGGTAAAERAPPPDRRTPVTYETVVAHYADRLAAGQVPSGKEIRAYWRIGSDKAREFHARMAGAAAAANGS